jgi:hypothetical protein
MKFTYGTFLASMTFIGAGHHRKQHLANSWQRLPILPIYTARFLGTRNGVWTLRISTDIQYESKRLESRNESSLKGIGAFFKFPCVIQDSIANP